MNCTKTSLRRQFLRRRQALSPEIWQSQSDWLCHHLANSPQFIAARTVLAYQSHRQEPNLDYLFTHTNKQWGLPRCVGKDLLWHCWQPSQPLVIGSYDILEPEPELPLVSLDRVDLILVPAVAITSGTTKPNDRGGYRLGYGGGYYDRLLTDPILVGVPTIGIVFDFADLKTPLANLPWSIDPWDMPLDAVCTELGLKNFD